MNKKLTGSASTSNPTESRFLSLFSSSRKQHSQKTNEHPPFKKPKLEIEKRVNCSQSVPSTTQTKKNIDLFDDLWGDDAEFEIALSQMPEVTMPVSNHENITKTMGFPDGSVSARENIPTPSKKKSLFTPVKNSPGIKLRRVASSGWPSTNNIDNDFNIGVKSIHTDFEQLTFEHNNLKEELNKKAGEVHVLRDKYSQVQQELDKQKIENVDKIEKLKQEAESNILHLTKELKSLQSQLDVKDMEINSAERRTQRLTSVNKLLPESPCRIQATSNRTKFSSPRVKNSQCVREDLICGRSLRFKSLPLELMQEMITPELLKPSAIESTIVESVGTITNSGLFSGQTEPKSIVASTSRNVSTSFYVTANTSIQNILSSVSRPLSLPCSSVEECGLLLVSSSLLDASSNNTNQVISQVLATCVQILKNHLHQLNVAVCPQNQYIEREREIMYCGYKYLVLSPNNDLLCCKELYNNERGICARRALALVSLLVEVSHFAAEQVLPRPEPETNRRPNDVPDTNCLDSESDPHKMLIVIKEIVHQIEKQRRTLIFEGVLAGATAVVKNLLEADISLSSESQEIMVDILKLVVFARPGSLVIENILRALLAATKYPDIINRICQNSAKKTFVENARLSEITYSQDTCLLQVLCVLIRLSETPKKHILSDVFTSWVLTLFYGMPEYPKWLFSEPSQTLCQCRRLISRLTFTLLGESCCHYPSISDDTIEGKSLDLLFSRGILLVCTLLYHDEYFGANVDPASVGYYELFLNSTFRNVDKKHNKACWDILSSLWLQEERRQPMRKFDSGPTQHLIPLTDLCSKEGSKKSVNVLDQLEAC